MHYLILGCDYDGTLALDGALSGPTIAALERFKKSARKLVMVTGRELPDLQKICSRLDLFDYIVAENGALLFQPSTQEIKVLGKGPPKEFVDLLVKRGVGPISVGNVVVATWVPHENTVLDCIRELGLELQVIFNKRAVMVLPAGVNKASGFTAALEEMKLSAHNAVGIGDAENDHAFLSMCECAVAVSNALPAVKEAADFVTKGDHGEGVVELIEEILNDDLASRAAQSERHHVVLGIDDNGREIKAVPRGFNGLLLGTSGSGKSTLTTGLLERLDDLGYTFAVIDPEGDYGTFEGAVNIGTPTAVPDMQEIVKLLDEPKTNVVINLLAVPFDDRPKVFASLFGHLQELRARTGRPHWIVIDESHHLMPTHWETAASALPLSMEGVLQITVHATLIAPTTLRDVNTVIVTGDEPFKMLSEFADIKGMAVPEIDQSPLKAGEALIWQIGSNESPVRVKVPDSHTERRRHIRKYAEGEMSEDRSFYFRGPDGKLNLRAQNLLLFLQLAEGVDDETWLFHLKQHDYSSWFRESVKDEVLADEVLEIENDDPDPVHGREQVRKAIESKYTLPAG